MPEVEFIIHYTTPMDQMMGLTGSIKELGEWNLENCTPMNFVRSADGNWRLKINMPENLLWEYKYVVMNESTKLIIKQETRSNREVAVADKDEVFRDGFNVERIEEERERLQKTRELQFEVELKRIAEQRERDQKLLEERLKRKEEKKEALRKKKIEELRKRKEEEKKKLKEQKKKELEDKAQATDSSARDLAERLRRERLDAPTSDSDTDKARLDENELLEELKKAEQEELLKKIEEEKKRHEEERERKIKERAQREEERRKQMEDENRKMEEEMEKRKEERRKRREERLKQQEEEEEKRKKEEEAKKKQEEQLLSDKFAAMMNKQGKVPRAKTATKGFNALEEQARAREARKKEEEERKRKEEEDKKRKDEEDEKKRKDDEDKKRSEEEEKKRKEEEEKKRKEEEEKKLKEEEEKKRKEEEEEERKKKEEEEKRASDDPQDKEEERRRRREERRKGRNEPAVVVEEEEDEERKKRRLEREARAAARAVRKDQRKKETDAEIEKMRSETAALVAAQEEERKKKEEEARLEQLKKEEKLRKEKEAERLKELYSNGRRDEATPLPEILPLDHEVLFASGKPNSEILKFHLLNQGRLEKQSVFQVISQVSEVLKEEPNLLELKAPLIIFGDIHGQFYDMIKMMNLSGDPSTTQYLFLGDYVDRGYFSTEVVLYLYSLKISYPKNVWLLRGNHECRGITAHYNFKAECLHKYDNEVYDSFCDSFDKLPLAALLESKNLGRWLAVHGGIGPQVKTLDDIRAIDRCVEIPEEGPLCDLLWSDPIEESSSNGLAGKALERWLNTEFRPNHTRGTSCFYGLKGVTQFLEANNLNCIIRAHEVQKHGFMEHRFLQTERETPYVITVFSAPNYCDKYENFACYVNFTDDEYESQMMTWTEHPYQLPHFIDVFSFISPFTAESVTKFFLQLLDLLRKGSKGTSTKQEDEEMEKKAQGMAKLMVMLKQNRMQNQSEVMPLADKYKQNLSMFDRAIREDGNNELRPLASGVDARKLSRIKSSPHVAGMAYGTKRAAVPQRQSTFHFGKKKATNVPWV